MNINKTNKKNLVPFICQTISIIELLIALIFVLAFNINTDSNAKFKNIEIYLFDYDRKSKCDTTLYENKSYVCNFYLNEDLMDRIKVTSSQEEVTIGRIVQYWPHNYYFIFYVGECSSEIDLTFKYDNVMYTKSFKSENIDIESRALVDVDIDKGVLDYDFKYDIIQTKSELEECKNEYPAIRPYLNTIFIDYSKYFLSIQIFFKTRDEEKYSFNSTFIYQNNIYADFFNNQGYIDPIFPIEGSHLSIIQISRNYIDLIPVYARISYMVEF